MKVQVVSDLHLEFRADFKNAIRPNGDILVMAGDICPLGCNRDRELFMAFLDFISSKFKYILHVAGNHEYYCEGSRDCFDMESINDWLRALSVSVPNYRFLNNTTFPLTHQGRTYHFAGTTLWTRIPEKLAKEVQASMNDYRKIYVEDKRHLNVDDVNKLHARGVAFLRRIRKLENVILITHHKPFLSPLKKDERNCAYETDLLRFLGPPLILAIHGHTHKHYDALVNGIRVVSNPRGYPHERTCFVPDLALQLKKMII
jgi:predicted phosphodiesterase